jgi:hypothetical protein
MSIQDRFDSLHADLTNSTSIQRKGDAASRAATLQVQAELSTPSFSGFMNSPNPTQLDPPDIKDFPDGASLGVKQCYVNKGLDMLEDYLQNPDDPEVEERYCEAIETECVEPA